MPLVQLLLHIDTYWPLSQSSIAINTRFSAPYPHSFCVPHPFHILHQLPLATQLLKTITYSNGSPFSIACIGAPLPYHEHLITLFLPTLTLNFFLPPFYQTPSPVHTTSPASRILVLHHLEITAGLSQTCHHSYSATPALPKHPNIHLSNHTIHIYIKQPWRHHSAQSQSNNNRNPISLTSFPTRTHALCYLCKTLHCFQQFSSNSIHS